MPKTKKKFIDRKKAVTFNLVHRSQRDPLAADETAPQRVLVPVNAVVPPRKEKDPELTPKQRKEEQMKYGVYFDDDYNYLQHLKDTREVTMVLQPKAVHKRKDKDAAADPEDPETNTPAKATLQLPSSVFASEVEEDVGLLNKAATQGLCLELDPDVVAALDEDFDFEDPDNQLEDNFIDLAMGAGSSDDEEYVDDAGDSMSDGVESDKAFASDLDSDDESDLQISLPPPAMPTPLPPAMPTPPPTTPTPLPTTSTPPPLRVKESDALKIKRNSGLNGEALLTLKAIKEKKSETLELVDEITTYGLYIAAQMRKFQPVLQSKLKLDIQSLLCKYELENIEYTSRSASSMSDKSEINN